jgi:hypothetical protein
MSDEQVGSGTTASGTGQPPPPPPAGDQPVEIDFNPLVGQEGGVDSLRHEIPNPDVETRG